VRSDADVRPPKFPPSPWSRRPAPIFPGLNLTAEFEPFQEVDVMAKVSGYIREIKVDIGDRVSEGQLLATLEIPEMQDDLTRAAAAIEEANADLSRGAR
jgi:multidrug efflux pump subunit AcrA (membrane-fusion protein)